MPVSWTRIETRQKRPTSEALILRARQVLHTFGEIGVREIRQRVWYASRFVYKNIKPRPSRSKSEMAWTYEVKAWGNTAEALIIFNPATNRKGFNYPKIVHLAGRPKSERLMQAVSQLTLGDLGNRLGKAVADAYIDERLKQPMVTTRSTIKG